MKKLPIYCLSGAAITLAMLACQSCCYAVTLDECINIALGNNASIRAATERIQAARAAIKEAQSAYYPMIGASAAYARTDNPPQAFMMLLGQRRASLQSDFNNPSDTENTALSLGLKYCLFDFGRRGLDNEMARGGAEISRLVLLGLQNDLIHQVTQGYYAVLQADAFVVVHEDTVLALQESLRVANELVKSGRTLKSDALNLEVQVAQAKDELIRSRNGVKLALAALNTAMGVNLASLSNMPDKVAEPDIKPSESNNFDAVRNRPELQAAYKMAEVQQAALEKSRRQFWPTINAFGSADWNSDVSFDLQQSYFAGITAEVSIFDGFRRSAAVAGASAKKRAAEAEAQKTADNLRLDLTSASIQVVDAWERLEVMRTIIESAEEALRITQQRYQEGAADIPELLTAQTGLTGTHARNAAALYDYLTAISNLGRARGELVQRYAKDEQYGK